MVNKIQQNLDLMSLAVKESERNARKNFFTNNFDQLDIITKANSSQSVRRSLSVQGILVHKKD